MAEARKSHRPEAPRSAVRTGPAPVRAAPGERRFELIDPSAPPPARPSRAHLLAVPLFVAALLLVALAKSLVLRALLPLALAIAATSLLVHRARRRRLAERERLSRRSLSVKSGELVFHPGLGGSPSPVVDLAEPFGATLLSTHRRDRLVLLLTSERGVFHVGTVIDPGALTVLAGVLARTTTVAGEDAAFESIGPDGDPVIMAPADFVALVNELSAGAPGCLGRVIVTDTRGAPVVLDEDELRVDSFAFDLTSPLEWRALVFQEPFGQVMTLYQGTWIRQGGSEVVLVSLLPSLGPILEVEPGEIASLDRAVLRDLRLMQASAETPPPREQRHAIERLLMMPIRSSLDRAPRKSRQPPVPRRPPLH